MESDNVLVMKSNRGVYGPDDVAWEVQESRDIANEAARRIFKQAFDRNDRLAAKTSLLFAHEQDGQLFQDSDNTIWIGYERNGSRYVFAQLDFDRQSLTFCPCAKIERHVAVWRKLSEVFDQIAQFTRFAPEGCI